MTPAAPMPPPEGGGRFVFADGDAWELAARTRVLGILNVTPDSFSDGGRHLDPAAAAERAAAMLAEGADAVDIGGESTRPGASPVPADLERERVMPVLRRVRREHPRARISVDTTRAALAREALDEGADIVNDVSAMRLDPDMAATVASARAACILMHMKGRPGTMQDSPAYADVMGEIAAFLEGRVRIAREAGVAAESIAVDPGIGFGKTLAHNLEILRRLPELARLGRPVLVGASRKSFIGALAGGEPSERLEGSLAAAAAAVFGGAAMVRVHDVRATVRLLRIVDAVAREAAA